MKRTVAFYRDVIGLTLRFEALHWTEFAMEGVTLALNLSDLGSPAANKQHSPAGRYRPGLSVPNLDEFHKKMVANGVNCPQPPKDVFGAQVAQYVDPDGLVISVGEECEHGA
jgi:predicted enzyme related to lactoylglutathione lyase